jgi:hypothetical protein
MYQPNTEQLLLMQEMQRDDVKYAQQLGKEYIELATDLPSFPVRGLVYDNEMGRRVVCLTIQRTDKRVWVPFVINSRPRCLERYVTLQA